ncbi:hypothetical protein MMC28_001524 [Mycoblastus sanguinarius]|nr:hypothetical protein [Mycoblastus sanguinarius]
MWVMELFIFLLALSSTIQAAPSVNLPINAQVPPVARVNQPFSFIFSDSTFTSAGTINYTLTNSPEWLQVDSPSRSFCGTPSSKDVGSFVVGLVASDETGSTSMPATLVVSEDPGPGLGTPVADQLPAYGAFSAPDSLLISSSSALSLSFSQNTFTNTNANTVYYSMCANNTPLPSWINFNPTNLSFSGTTPPPTSPSQLSEPFGIQLAASDVVGFAGAIATFQLIIESHLFSFGSSFQTINVTNRSPVNFTGLLRDLLLDGQPVNPFDVGQVVAKTPSWLSLDPTNLILSGTPPSDAAQQNFTVTATDLYGDIASTVVLIETIKNSESLIGPISPLNATLGTDFSYSLNATLQGRGENVTVDLGSTSAWLEFNTSSLEIQGHVPSNLKPQAVSVNVTAVKGNQSQSQILTINITSTNQLSGQPATNHSSAPKATKGPGSGTSNSTAAASNSGLNSHKNWIAAAVIVPLAAVSGALFLLYYCLRRKRRRNAEAESLSSSKRQISRPILDEKGQDVEPEMNKAQQINPRRAFSKASKAPMVDIPGLWAPRTTKRHSRFRLSRATMGSENGHSRPDSWQRYLGGLDSARQQSMAVPEFGLLPEEQTPRKPDEPHHGSKASALAISGPSLGTDASPIKRYSKQKKRGSTVSYGSSGIFLGQRLSGFGHGRNALSQGSSNLLFGSKGVGHGDGRLTGGPPGFNTIRNSWRNLNAHTRSSTTTEGWTSTEGSSSQGLEREPTQKSFASTMSSQFPLPPAPNVAERNTLPELPHHSGAHQATICLVGTPSKTRSTLRSGHRSRPRPGSTSETLQVFHKRRARQRNSRNPFLAAGPSAHTDSAYSPDEPPPHFRNLRQSRTSPKRRSNGNIVLEPSTPQRRTLQRSYSQSSSLEPPSKPSPSRSAKSIKSNASPRRPKSRNLYNFTTRLVSPLRFSRSSAVHSRSSFFSSSDSQFESAPSEAQSLGAFDLNPSLQEETDEEGQKRWRHADHPNPLGTNRTDVSDQELIESLRATGFGTAAQRLSYLRAHAGAGDEGQLTVGNTRGKRLEQNIEMGLRHGDPGNTSMRGDIGDGGGSTFV